MALLDQAHEAPASVGLTSSILYGTHRRQQQPGESKKRVDLARGAQQQV